MPSILVVMIIAGCALAYWERARAAAERAEALGRDACIAAGVQWLDQTVHAAGLRIQRNDDGKLGFERTFRFEYSYDGSDRHVGRLVLRSGRLVSFSGPVRAANVVQLH